MRNDYVRRSMRAFAKTSAPAALLLAAACDEVSPPPYLHHPPHCGQQMVFFDSGVSVPIERTREMLANRIKTPFSAQQVCVLDPAPTNRYRMYVTGHTDKTGSETSNQQLGMFRAQAVAGFLIELGVAREYICVQSFGSTKLLVEGGPADEPQNRRVEVTFERRQAQDRGCLAGAVPPSP